MKPTTMFIAALVICVSGIALAEDKKGQATIDKEKREGTYTMDKSGTWKVGGGELPKKSESSMTEKDRREQQQNTGGQVFIRKTY